MSKRQNEVDEGMARADGQQPVSAKDRKAMRDAIQKVAKRFPPNQGGSGKK